MKAKRIRNLTTDKSWTALALIAVGFFGDVRAGQPDNPKPEVGKPVAAVEDPPLERPRMSARFASARRVEWLCLLIDDERNDRGAGFFVPADGVDQDGLLSPADAVYFSDDSELALLTLRLLDQEGKVVKPARPLRGFVNIDPTTKPIDELKREAQGGRRSWIDKESRALWEAFRLPGFSGGEAGLALGYTGHSMLTHHKLSGALFFRDWNDFETNIVQRANQVEIATKSCESAFGLLRYIEGFGEKYSKRTIPARLERLAQGCSRAAGPEPSKSPEEMPAALAAAGEPPLERPRMSTRLASARGVDWLCLRIDDERNVRGAGFFVPADGVDRDGLLSPADAVYFSNDAELALLTLRLLDQEGKVVKPARSLRGFVSIDPTTKPIDELKRGAKAARRPWLDKKDPAIWLGFRLPGFSGGEAGLAIPDRGDECFTSEKLSEAVFFRDWREFEMNVNDHARTALLATKPCSLKNGYIECFDGICERYNDRSLPERLQKYAYCRHYRLQ